MKKFLWSNNNLINFQKLKLIAKYASQLIVAKKIEWFIVKYVKIVFMKGVTEFRNQTKFKNLFVIPVNTFRFVEIIKLFTSLRQPAQSVLFLFFPLKI